MAVSQFSSGLIGLGSRVFLGREAVWGTAATADTTPGLEIFNIYPQPGSRPQKTYASIEVPQLFPSMFRLKPLKGRTTVAGSFTFSLPKENLGTFLTLVTGDTSGPYEMQEVNNESWTIIQTLGARQAARYTGMKANSMTLNVTTDSVVSFDIDFMGKDEEFSGDLGTPANITTMGSWFQYPVVSSEVDVDIGLVLAGDYIEITDLGNYTAANWATLGAGNTAPAFPNVGDKFTALTNGVTSTSAEVKRLDLVHPFILDSSGNITGLQDQEAIGTGDPEAGSGSTTFDKFVDVYSSTEAVLRVARSDEKVIANTGSANTSWESSDDFIIPFSDFSLTINHALDFPAYINGTQDPNEPIPAGFRELTGTMTVPFNQHTDGFVSGLYNREAFKAQLSFINGDKSVKVDMPNFCLTGDGSPASVPEGEITLPISFGVYAGVDSNSTFDSTENIKFTVDEIA